MLVSYVFRGVVIRIESVPTLSTLEQRLGATIRTMLIATFTACLRSVAGVYALNSNLVFLPFVGNEAVELGKGPIVQFAFGVNMLILFATPDLARVSKVGEILKHDGSACRGMLDDSSAQNVVCVPVESVWILYRTGHRRLPGHLTGLNFGAGLPCFFA
jgi:hypothetical protein